MGTFTRESGRTAKPMDTGSSLTQMAACMRGNGSMTSSTDSAQSLGITTKSSILETLPTARNLDQVDSNSTGGITRENS